MEEAFIGRAVHGKGADKGCHAKLVAAGDEGGDSAAEPVEGGFP